MENERKERKANRPVVKLNGYPMEIIFKKDFNKVVSELLLQLYDRYSPLEVKVSNFISLLEFLADVALEVGENRSRTRLLTTIKYIKKWKFDAAGFDVHYYNMILGHESLGLLQGYGFSNSFGDKLEGNPEYDTRR